MKYHCNTCGQEHDDLPFSYGAQAPAAWYDVPESERSARTKLSADQCVIDSQHFFILGNIEIPIIDANDTFVLSVWCTLSQENFRKTQSLWRKAFRWKEPPYFGWMNTQTSIYPETINLKTSVQTRKVGLRPLIRILPCEHQLYIDQERGVTIAKVQQFAELLIHPRT